MKNWLLVVVSAAIFSGCASVNSPKITYRTNFSLSSDHSVTVRNSAGPSVVLVPQGRGDGFVAEYQLGKRTFRTLWLVREKIPTKLVELKHGETFTIPMHRNTSDRYVDIPFAVKVIERGKVIGVYSYCMRADSYRNNVFELNFGPRELRALKQGDIGYQCGNRGYYW